MLEEDGAIDQSGSVSESPNDKTNRRLQRTLKALCISNKSGSKTSGCIERRGYSTKVASYRDGGATV